MPEAGSIVTCRVLSVHPNQATVSIICVGPNKMHSPVSGTVKKQNVRDHQIDAVSLKHNMAFHHLMTNTVSKKLTISQTVVSQTLLIRKSPKLVNM